MKVTTRGCYGLRAMLELAQYYGGGPVLIRTIAENQGLSSKYLHALLTSLKSAGLVRSVRGSGGGFKLARAPSEISVKEIISALEGNLCLSDCVTDPKSCQRSKRCVTNALWHDISVYIDNFLGSVTLEDLLTRQSERFKDAPMYHI